MVPTSAPLTPQLVVALDNTTPERALELAGDLGRAGVQWFKIGLELYTQAGPRLVQELKGRGLNVFLDLKLYDIPNTVSKAVKAAVGTKADLLTVHCSGGSEMLAAAQESAAGSSLSLLGVTVLTSLAGSTFEEVCASWGARENARVPRGAVVIRLAEQASRAGLPGIVCSASDLHDGEIRRLPWKSPRPLLVTPGIRNTGDAVNDQKSTATAEQAVRLGATHLVVGRPITAPASGTSEQAVRSFLQQIRQTHGV